MQWFGPQKNWRRPRNKKKIEDDFKKMKNEDDFKITNKSPETEEDLKIFYSE